ncbi:sporulation protein YqfD [Anaerovorax odorimutans]|uniref:sporulation protein YqfD n=1 Tax=Anaerovorax odorimutans TaxID=109327 RepID=UPI0004023AEA|nr:sporulation protein YqfD [Anaerovorax odorimutans]
MRENSSFFEHYKQIKVEGFDQQRLINNCAKEKIILRDIKIKNDIEMTFKIMAFDYKKFLRLARNKYQITVISENGYKPLIKKIFNKKSTIIGLILFAFIMYYQSSFISEIRINGYEKFTEAQVRNCLREAGFYEGCSKNISIDEVKLYLYNNLEDLSWVGISYVGNLAEVTIVEGTKPVKKVDPNKPTHIVADKDGYIDKIIAREGFATVSEGAFVKKGDIVISGIVPITNNNYSTTSSAALERYVHASGEVTAKVPYRFTYYQERYDLIKEPTGKTMYGINLKIGNFNLNTGKLCNRWETSVYKENNIFKTIRPLPLSLSVTKTQEVKLYRRECDKEEVKKASEILLRHSIKDKIRENSQILNKSLKFSKEENIIEVTVMLEALEQIGSEEDFVIGERID